MARPLIEKALELVEKDAKSDIVPRVILEAPTGYGKSVAAPLFAKSLIEYGMSHGLIHSLPLRAIVTDIYLCLLVNSLTQNPTLRERCRKSEEVLREVAGALESVEIDVSQVAYQMGESILSDFPGARKEPLFNARYIVTTLDSLAYNAFRIPVTEIFSPRKHYATPRLRMFISTIYLDEAHTVYEEEDSGKSVAVFKEILKISVASSSPVIVASATLSNHVEKDVIEELKTARIVKLGPDDKVENNFIYVRDKDFEDFVKSVKWNTDFINEQELVGKVKQLVESGQRVFVARDSVCAAIMTYRSLRDELELGSGEIALLHSLMTKRDREDALERVNRGDVKVLVATSVVEAGVDMSFDALFTDCGRPASIVQRAGRICRTPSSCRHAEAFIYLLRNDALNPKVEQFVEKLKDRGKELSWRLPYDSGDHVSYIRMLNDFEKYVRPDPKLTRKLRALVNPLVISSGTIHSIFKALDYALIRTHLVEIFLQGENALEAHSIVTSLDKLAYLTNRGCIEGLYAVFDDVVEKTEDLSQLRGGNLEKELLKKHLDVLEKLSRDPARRSKLLRLAYMLRKQCYVCSEGVEYGVLCLQRG